MLTSSPNNDKKRSRPRSRRSSGGSSCNNNNNNNDCSNERLLEKCYQRCTILRTGIRKLFGPIIYANNFKSIFHDLEVQCFKLATNFSIYNDFGRSICSIPVSLPSTTTTSSMGVAVLSSLSFPPINPSTSYINFDFFADNDGQTDKVDSLKNDDDDEDDKQNYSHDVDDNKLKRQYLLPRIRKSGTRIVIKAATVEITDSLVNIFDSLLLLKMSINTFQMYFNIIELVEHLNQLKQHFEKLELPTTKR